VQGQTATFFLLRCKNFFAHGGKKDPTRFRRMNLNVILQYDQRTVIAELQLHHRAISHHNATSHAHDHYDFWRSNMASSYEEDMDAMLERTISFLDEVRGVPVLLSMLVLIFKNRQEGSTALLPRNRR